MEFFKRLSEKVLQLIGGFTLFILSFSGLLCALLLRHYKYNGIVIALIGVLIEIIAIALCYYFFKNYLTKEEEVEKAEKKGKQK
jgi:hypothetical protein